MDYFFARRQMIETQLRPRGIVNPRVLEIMGRVPRHEFVCPELASSAYNDSPLPIGSGQTISQPYMVALMTELLELEADARVLEIGTGCGYQTAILSGLCREVYSVERRASLAEDSRLRLERLGCANARVLTGDGTKGLTSFAPYDAIIVTAGAPAIPEAFTEQLSDGGRLVIPIGGRASQELLLFRKNGEKLNRRPVTRCVFVPLIGINGWSEN